MFKKIFTLFISACLCLTHVSPVIARARTIELPPESVQTIHNQIEARVFAYKKTKYYTAVEIGFTNTTGNYVEFTPQEIYLDDAVKYSQSLLSMDQVRDIEQRKPGASLFPLALGVGLGIAALATARTNKDAGYYLGVAALGMGGAALLTKGFENRAKDNKFIAFENNTLSNIKRLPPGITLGGVLYFPPTKKPQSVTLIAKSRSGKYERKVFHLPGK